MKHGEQNNDGSDDGKLCVQTTVGDLICAISDAASEAEVAEDELWQLTAHIFNQTLEKCSRLRGITQAPDSSE
ncbi:MAG: hypothetical protein PHC51_12260 [bacterium]|nr:hypothetical protein [bacterium]